MAANTSADVERMTMAYVEVLHRQACRYRGELPPARLPPRGPRIGLEYCLLGDRCLRQRATRGRHGAGTCAPYPTGPRRGRSGTGCAA